ncbi:hypothetical protein HOLleu_22814 [Holothuria leucospilota]|uniref:Uncharacterized protein n=1 Tax=Holothuria leucospilota TaxID=206669 RepID=A0A9Q1BU84_HOLLE|nr:hypothetical protein HOLleu_22814 [Holothuria leucospilota]
MDHRHRHYGNDNNTSTQSLYKGCYARQEDTEQSRGVCCILFSKSALPLVPN